MFLIRVKHYPECLKIHGIKNQKHSIGQRKIHQEDITHTNKTA